MDDDEAMHRALALAASVRALTSPNPWVGSVVLTADGERFEGATAAPGGPHAEASALAKAGTSAAGATLYTTLEPCSHRGRTPPCADAIVAAGIARVVVGIRDPDPQVAEQSYVHDEPGTPEPGSSWTSDCSATGSRVSWRPTSSIVAPGGRGWC